MTLLPRRRFLVLGMAAAACRPHGDAQAPDASSPPPRLPDHADLVVRGGTIFTADPTRPRVDAVAIGQGVVLAVGEEAAAGIGPRTQVLDLAGGAATPGLVDAHAHLVGLGQSLEQVDLRGAASVEEVVARLREQAPPTGWVTGRGWDQNLWPGAGMPDHTPLTQAFPDRPVWLRRIDGHAGWGNRTLLELAEIGKTTAPPEGGEILRGRGAAPTGVLVDAAMGLVPVPAPAPEELERQILAGQQHMLDRGLTGVHDMGIGPDADAVYRRLASDPRGGLRVRVHAYAAQGWFARDLHEHAPDPVTAEARYILKGVKLYADGALGSRGAALLAPYADRPGHRGLMQQSGKDLGRLVHMALRAGFQVATHAIGDAANRQVLDAYAQAQADVGADDPRLRIEHCQIVDPADIERFGQLGVIASMQPTHATSDMGWVPERLGPTRLAGAYAWQKFLAAGARLCFGSDFPVERVDVTHGLHAAVTRQDPNGQPVGGWLPGERVDLERAIQAFSSDAAYAVHREDHLGMLRPGYRADVTCFEAPIFNLPAAQLRDTPIRGTIVDGRIERWT